MGSKKEKKNPPPPPKPEEESSEEGVEEDVEEDVEEEEEEFDEKEVEEEPHQKKKPQPSSSSSGTETGSDEDGDDHSTSHPIPSSVKRQATPPPEIVPNSDDDDETESDDDDEEEADLASDSPRSATPSAYTVKPITTVPVNSKVSKPTQKRALESSKNDAKGSTDRKKAKTGEENEKKGKSGGGFPGRVWSEESEIVMLQGILDYQREKGPIRSADTGVFYEFIKGKLWDGVTKTQIGDKIKRLKTKYGNIVKKGKNGQDPTFTKPHDKKAFELSKQIWGAGSSSVSNGKEEKAKTKVVDNGKEGKKVSNAAGSETKRVVEEDSSKVKVKSDDPKGKKGINDGSALMDVDVDVNGGAKQELAKKDELKKGDLEGDFMSKFPTLSNSFDIEIMKDYLHLIGSQNASELEEEWKQLQLEEMNVAAKRVILKGKQTKLVLDAMKKQ